MTTENKEYDFWKVNNFVPHDVCDLLLSYGNWSSATVKKGKLIEKIRECEVSWIKEDFWKTSFYNIMRDINDHAFKFDIKGMGDLQLTQYLAPAGHFDYHVDLFNGFNPPNNLQRKLSMSVLLNDVSEFDGGIFEYLIGHEPSQIEMNKGDVVVFPSYYLHRVTPVTEGKRYSLVAWALGEPLK